MERLTLGNAGDFYQILESFLATCDMVTIETIPVGRPPETEHLFSNEVALEWIEQAPYGYALRLVHQGAPRGVYPVRADDFIPTSWVEYYVCFGVHDDTVYLSLTNTEMVLRHHLTFF